jgi:hypothetical protein
MINAPVSCRRQLPLLFLLLLVLPSCAVPPPVPRHKAPAPIERPQPSAPIERPEAPVPAQPPPSVQSGPARSLHVKASEALAAGHADKAEMLLERALRIEPRNALLWHLLGQSKYAQGDYLQAVEFCRKSESLAGNNNKLREYNRSLLQKAYKKLGDTEQAEKLGR